LHACTLWLLQPIQRLRLHRVGIGFVIVNDGFMEGGARTFHYTGS
jgi:hypothetical protein